MGLAEIKLGLRVSSWAPMRDKASRAALTIRTGRGAAGLHLLLAVEAGEACRAAAGVAALRVVCTPSPVEARPICTRHGTQLAGSAVKAGRTGAGVAVLKILRDGEYEKPSSSCSRRPTQSMSSQGPLGRRARRAWTHRAAAPVPAGAGATLVNLGLAGGPRVPRPARAGVASLARVGAGGPVLAGLVMCAVVEV